MATGGGYIGPMNKPISRTVAVLTPGAAAVPSAAGRVISCHCTTIGDVTFTLAGDGTSLTETLVLGSNWFEASVTAVALVGGANGVFTNLD